MEYGSISNDPDENIELTFREKESS